MFWGNRTPLPDDDAPLYIPTTDQEKLDLLAPHGFSNKIVECGSHTLYIVYNDDVYYCQHNLKLIQLIFTE